MQKLYYNVRQSTTEDYDSLKSLWQKSFGDEESVIDNFFSRTVVPENIIGVFQGNEVLSALYIVECEAVIDKRCYSAFYVYGVSTDAEYRNRGLMREAFSLLERIAKERKTDYLFLVPANESLFSMYEKLGYKTGISYKEKECAAPHCQISVDVKPINYDCYKRFRDEADFSHIDLKEKGFDSFLNPAENSIKSFCVDNYGYCIYEKEDGILTVHELFGNEDALLSVIFTNEKCGKIIVREHTDDTGIPLGMYKIIGNAPELRNVFFGIPYGG